jgi:hypothetical protein
MSVPMTGPATSQSHHTDQGSSERETQMMNQLSGYTSQSHHTGQGSSEENMEGEEPHLLRAVVLLGTRAWPAQRAGRL